MQMSKLLREVHTPPPDTPKSLEEEWADSVNVICFEMAQKPTWRRRAELLSEALLAVHRYFGKCAARK